MLWDLPPARSVHLGLSLVRQRTGAKPQAARSSPQAPTPSLSLGLEKGKVLSCLANWSGKALSYALSRSFPLLSISSLNFLLPFVMVGGGAPV